MHAELSAPESAGGAVRLFVAVELPEDIRNILHSRTPNVPGLRRANLENLHLTLRFLGEVPQKDRARVREALFQVRAACFFLRIQGLGLFARGGQSVLWAGLEPSEPLRKLKERVDLALARGSGIAPEKSAFSPHITLGRMKTVLPTEWRGEIKARAGEFLAAFSVGSFTLFSSLLRPGGALHAPERRYALTIPC